MISERISQIFMYDIRNDIKYDIKHDIKVSLPILKTGCIERCQSRALQVQVQAVQNQWWWSSALLDDARLVLGVRRIQTGDVRHRVSQSIIVLGRLPPNHARPVFLVVRQSRRGADGRSLPPWTARLAAGGGGRFIDSGGGGVTGSGGIAGGASGITASSCRSSSSIKVALCWRLLSCWLFCSRRILAGFFFPLRRNRKSLCQ